jgi:hypothetical protein
LKAGNVSATASGSGAATEIQVATASIAAVECGSISDALPIHVDMTCEQVAHGTPPL